MICSSKFCLSALLAALQLGSNFNFSSSISFVNVFSCMHVHVCASVEDGKFTNSVPCSVSLASHNHGTGKQFWWQEHSMPILHCVVYCQHTGMVQAEGIGPCTVSIKT